MLTGGKFANGAVNAVVVYLFNDLKSTAIKKIRDSVVDSEAKKAAKSHGINKSMSNILGDGAKGFVGGAIAGTAVAGFPFGTVSGAIYGTGGGLVTGAALESSGINDSIEDGINAAQVAGEAFYQGAINTYEFLRCGYGGCK